jgi:outer membrane PBP1 activator LpoA protein
MYEMSAHVEAKSLAKQIEKEAKKEPLLIAVMKSSMGRSAIQKFAKDLAKTIKGKVVRSGFTPNSEISLFELRRDGLAVVLLVLRSDVDSIVTVEATTDHEIAEIESNIYSSNINDVYVRLVSDIF